MEQFVNVVPSRENEDPEIFINAQYSEEHVMFVNVQSEISSFQLTK